MFEQERIKSLLDIFRQHLWRDSEFNVYMTFLASTRELGQRVPLDPRDQEGYAYFSIQLDFNQNFHDTTPHLQNKDLKTTRNFINTIEKF